MILKLLLNTWMIRVIFTELLKNTVQIKKHKILIAFDDMIADMLGNKMHNSTVIELFIGGGKWNISLVFVAQSYFAVPNNIRLMSAHYITIKIANKQEHQWMAFNHS